LSFEWPSRRGRAPRQTANATHCRGPVVLTLPRVVNEWITVAQAAGLMRLSKRQALRLLARRNANSGGRLLRAVGDKCMPRGVQASKFMVSTSVLLESLRPDSSTLLDLESLRLEVDLLRQQVAALRRAVGRSSAPPGPVTRPNATSSTP
jgi:hypothetical protein